MDPEGVSGRPEAGRPLSEICAGLARLYHDRWGRGPRTCRAHWAGPDVIVAILENGHTTAERTLRAAGHGAEVLDGRLAMQAVLQAEMRALVERATSRSVYTVLSSTRLDPDLSSEVFLLVPAEDTATAAPAAAAAEQAPIAGTAA